MHGGTQITRDEIFVTGATGFLGTALVKRLAGEGVPVRAFVRSLEKGEELKHYGDVTLVQGDLLQAEPINEAVSGCRTIFHCAAALTGNLAFQRAVNVAGTRRVIQAAIATRVKRIVHVSSISVYGYRPRPTKGILYIDESYQAQESHMPYVLTKIEAEATVRELATRHNLPYSIIRPGIIVGPRSQLWTKQLFKWARRKPTLFVGNGQGTAPIIHIDDVVDLCLRIARHEAAIGEAFNAVIDPQPSWRQFLGAYASLAGHKCWLGLPVPFVKLCSQSLSYLARPNTRLKELPWIIGLITNGAVQYDMQKAHRLLGWSPAYDLEKAAQSCIPWLTAEGLLPHSSNNA